MCLYATKFYANELPNWAIYRENFKYFSFVNPIMFSNILMFDMDDILPDDSVSQLSQPGSSSLNLSSHILSSEKQLPIPPGIQVIDRCMVVENTPECLNKLVEHFP